MATRYELRINGGFLECFSELNTQTLDKYNRCALWKVKRP